MNKQIQKYKAKPAEPIHESGLQMAISPTVEMTYTEIEFTNTFDGPLREIKVGCAISASELSGVIPDFLPAGESFTQALIIYTNDQNREADINKSIHIDARK